MTRFRRHSAPVGSIFITILTFATLVAFVAAPSAAQGDPPRPAPQRLDPVTVHLKPLPDGVHRVLVDQGPDGSHEIFLEMDDGSTRRLSPGEFATLLYDSESSKSGLHRFLNISSAAGFWWVLLGLLGQVLFTGRMVLQWLVSEKARRSVVPVAFWWMSLAGASMLLIYFVWRRDIVGVLGQSTGWFIYTRNLWLIYRPGRRGKPRGTDRAAPEERN